MEISNTAQRSSWSIDGLSSRFEKSQIFSGLIVGNSRQSPNLVSSMGRADLLWPRVDLDLTRKVRSNTGRVNVDQRWARLEAGRGGDSFDPL